MHSSITLQARIGICASPSTPGKLHLASCMGAYDTCSFALHAGQQLAHWALHTHNVSFTLPPIQYPAAFRHEAYGVNICSTQSQTWDVRASGVDVQGQGQVSPLSSKPLRPARPLIWMYSPEESHLCSTQKVVTHSHTQRRVQPSGSIPTYQRPTQVRPQVIDVKGSASMLSIRQCSCSALGMPAPPSTAAPATPARLYMHIARAEVMAKRGRAR